MWKQANFLYNCLNLRDSRPSSAYSFSQDVPLWLHQWLNGLFQKKTNRVWVPYFFENPVQVLGFLLYIPLEIPDKSFTSLETPQICVTPQPDQKLRKLGNFFLRFLNLIFQFWLQGKIENLEIRKLGIIFLRFPRFLRFLSFRFATFSFFKELFFLSILQYSFLELS